jgi:hypothetical protein
MHRDLKASNIVIRQYWARKTFHSIQDNSTCAIGGSEYLFGVAKP